MAKHSATISTGSSPESSFQIKTETHAQYSQYTEEHNENIAAYGHVTD